MFGKKRIEEMAARFGRLEGEVKLLQDDMSLRSIEMVTCKRCGCAVIKNDAIRGESVVETRVTFKSVFKLEEDEEYVKEIYYCKRCAKKQAKQK